MSDRSKRVFRVVKGGSTVQMAKVAGGAASEAWRRAWSSKGSAPSLVEEPESEVEDSGEEEEVKPWLLSQKARRLRARFAREARKERRRWRLQARPREDDSRAQPRRDLLGSAEASPSTYYLLRESNGVFEATEVTQWVAFKPAVAYETLPFAVAESALKDGRAVDVDAAKAAMPWRNKHDDDDDVALERFKEIRKRKSNVLANSRLGKKLDGDGDEEEKKKPSARGGGGGSGGSGARKKTAEAIFEDSGTRLDIGLSAGGEDEVELNEGMGDDGLDFEEDFQDDEAEEEKQDEIDELASDDEDEALNLDDDDAAAAADKASSADKKTKKKAVAAEETDDDAVAADDDDDRDVMTSSPPPPLPAPEDEDASKKRKQEEPAPQQSAAKRSKTLTNGPLTTNEVKQEMIARGGRVKLRELLQHFKARITGDAQKKSVLKRILKDIGDMSEDAVDGRVLVLKAHLRPPHLQ